MTEIDPWAPDELAAMEQAVTCPDCGSKMALKNSQYGLFYGCVMFPNCTATHGAHQSNGRSWTMGAPLGVPASKEVRILRTRAHALAAELLTWNDHAQKNQFYRWLRREMGLGKDCAHIAMMDKAKLERLIGKLEERKARKSA